MEVVGEQRVHEVLADEVTEVNEQAADCMDTVIVFIRDQLELEATAQAAASVIELPFASVCVPLFLSLVLGYR